MQLVAKNAMIHHLCRLMCNKKERETAADKMNAFPDAAEIKCRVSFHNFFFHISSYTCFI